MLKFLRYVGTRRVARIEPSLPQAPQKEMPVGLSGQGRFESLHCQFLKGYHKDCRQSTAGLRRQNRIPPLSLMRCGLGAGLACSSTEPESVTDQKTPTPHRRSHPEV